MMRAIARYADSNNPFCGLALLGVLVWVAAGEVWDAFASTIQIERG